MFIFRIWFGLYSGVQQSQPYFPTVLQQIRKDIILFSSTALQNADSKSPRCTLYQTSVGNSHFRVSNTVQSNQLKQCKYLVYSVKWMARPSLLLCILFKLTGLVLCLYYYIQQAHNNDFMLHIPTNQTKNPNMLHMLI